MKKLIKTAVMAGITCLCAFTVTGTENSIINVQQKGNRTVKAEIRQAKKGDGYIYTRNVSGGKNTKPFLNVIAGWGDIEMD